MQIHLSPRHLTLTAAIYAYVAEKISHLEQLTDRILAAHVVLLHDETTNQKAYRQGASGRARSRYLCGGRRGRSLCRHRQGDGQAFPAAPQAQDRIADHKKHRYAAWPAKRKSAVTRAARGRGLSGWDYKVKLEVFEGPLDLLLYLIKRDEVDIYDISIERITKQYLEYMEAFQVLNIDVAGEFIVMAANLLYIKSRTLLPRDQQMPEEDAEEDDPRWELIRQLIEYKKFKEGRRRAPHARGAAGPALPAFPRRCPELGPADNLLVEEVGIFDLINAFQKILKRLERHKREDLREIFEENHTVGDKIDYLLKVTSQGVALRFEECFAEAASRAEIVVTFLAMLEFIRLKQICVRQENSFSEIWIERVFPAAGRPRTPYE